MSEQSRKMSFNIPQEEEKELKKRARKKGEAMTGRIRRALRVLDLLEDEILDPKAEITLTYPDGQTKKVLVLF